jgi:hypothetical protein
MVGRIDRKIRYFGCPFDGDPVELAMESTHRMQDASTTLDCVEIGVVEEVLSRYA